MINITIECGEKKLIMEEKGKKNNVIQVDGYINKDKIFSVDYKKAYSPLRIINNVELCSFIEKDGITIEHFGDGLRRVSRFDGEFNKVAVWEKGKKEPIVFRLYKRKHNWDISIGQVCLRARGENLDIEVMDIVNNGIIPCLFKKKFDQKLVIKESEKWQLLYKKEMICSTFPIIDGTRYQLNMQCLQNICNSTFVEGKKKRNKFFDLTKQQERFITKQKTLKPNDYIIVLKTVNLDGTVEF